jgi:glycosyltransferase involved in cell wall biosynthesis
MRWQQMFIGGLREAGHRVRWIGHEPHRTWPWGPLRVWPRSHQQIVAVDPAGHQVGYINVSRLRNISLRKAYRHATLEALRSERPDVLISYNANPWIQGAVDAVMGSDIPWVPVILECLDPLENGWGNFLQSISRARGVAFISHWLYEHAPVEKKHLLSGAVVPRPAAPTVPRHAGPPVLLYAGAHSRAGGLDRLVSAMQLIKSPGVRLVVTGQGKGLDPQITRACETTPGVEDLGMVPESRLVELATAADVLVNPRPLDFEDNRTNFPSKLLDYLSYKRPIVSTRTAGIGPGYDDIVYFTASDEPADIAAAIDQVLSMSAADRDAWMRRITEAVKKLTPERSARELTTWFGDVLTRGEKQKYDEH